MRGWVAKSMDRAFGVVLIVVGTALMFGSAAGIAMFWWRVLGEGFLGKTVGVLGSISYILLVVTHPTFRRWVEPWERRRRAERDYPRVRIDL